MPASSAEPEKPLTTQQVDEWLYAITSKHLELYLHLMDTSVPFDRERALLEMSKLLREAIEEVA
jgi:hypothetical protein